MRNLEQFLSAYGESHQNPINQWVHFICVPLIFFSTVALLWLVPVGRWIGLPEWINGATMLAVVSFVFYLRLKLWVLAMMAVWFAVSVAGIYAIQGAGLSLLWISVAIWVAAWVGQVWGHKVEGKKPSFVDDLVFLLVGPVFVSVEIGAKLGIRSRYALH
ncbi:MAG: DUF962 domain-containing protein [Alcanivoracaceae bacterium]